ncbi:MAG TPA: diguanylate cyclase [Chthonomonadaceae bacterium]|nr:diguanylate cyclase [Chthonomonadaceae bacterium]
MIGWGIAEALTLAGGAVAAVWMYRMGWRRAQDFQAKHVDPQLLAERDQARQLCFATLEALTYAMEASDPYNIGYLEDVQRTVMLLTTVLKLPDEEAEALRAAALLHIIGRLGIPKHILHKTEALTLEEEEKVRLSPDLSARVLDTIPFPWPVVLTVRHHTEHWDGSGYPDGLRGSAIPYGARILAVASAYSAWIRMRAFRTAYTPEDAMAEIETRSGTQFDPAVVAAFRKVLPALQVANGPEGEGAEAEGADLRSPSSNPYMEIAAAQRETLGMTRLAQALAGAPHIEALGDILLQCVQEIVPCAACVLFLPEDEGDYLRAHAARGVNARHLLGSLAHVGAYVTGRAFSRGEITRASFLSDDLTLRDVSDNWTPFRSTLIVPLPAQGRPCGTLNLYAEEPNAFGPDAMRVMRMAAVQAGHAIEKARRFNEVQETAYTDALTGLRNARFLREFLEREINRAGRENVPLAVLNIDLDNFKPINDHFGHARGDQTLKEIAEILTTHVRNYDLAARYAGDEFVVVLAQANRFAAEVVAEKLKLAVEKHGQRLCAEDPSFPMLGMSIGIALFPEDGQDLQSLLCRSDAAMFHDKQQRKAGRRVA